MTPRSPFGPAAVFVPAVLVASHLGPTTQAGQAQEAPAPRAHHQLVFDATEARVYLVGGSTPRGSGYHYFDEVWSWSGRSWTPEPSLPFPRSSHRVVHHRGRNSLVLFGGGFGRALRSEGVLWERRSEDWRAVDGDFRAGASEPGMCYDRKRDQVVIFGGWDRPGDFKGETWVWGGDGMVRVETPGPSARSGHALLWDPVREGCLLFGGRGETGYHDDTWLWDGETWSEIPVQGPSARWFFGSATDPTGRRILLFGGRGESGDLGDTWAWNGTRWRRVATAGPTSRSMAKMAFSGEGVLLFGGRREVEGELRDLADTWHWDDAGGWSRR